MRRLWHGIDGDDQRSWTGFRFGAWGLRCWVCWDMATNKGYNEYEELLHVVHIGPLQWRWYALI